MLASWTGPRGHHPVIVTVVTSEKQLLSELHRLLSDEAPGFLYRYPSLCLQAHGLAEVQRTDGRKLLGRLYATPRQYTAVRVTQQRTHYVVVQLSLFLRAKRKRRKKELHKAKGSHLNVMSWVDQMERCSESISAIIATHF